MSVLCFATYTHDFAVEIDDEKDVDRIAEEHGFTNLGVILPGHYHFRHKRIRRRSALNYDDLVGSSLGKHSIYQESSVRWIEQQQVKRRVKRDYELDPSPQSPNDPLYDHMWYMDPNFKELLIIFTTSIILIRIS